MKTFGLAAGLVTATVLAISAGAAGQDASSSTACIGEIKATVVKGIVHYCGPATAHISVFPGVTFRHGSCTSTESNGLTRLTVEVGSRTLDRRTNGGRAYLNLQVYSAPPRPPSGGVLAYARRKRWTGVGVSFKVAGNRGTFAARGMNGSRGPARGSFRC